MENCIDLLKKEAGYIRMTSSRGIGMAGENLPEIVSTEQNFGAFEKAVARAELLNKAARQAAEYSIKASQEALSRAEARKSVV